MADLKISQLSAATTPLAGTEVLPLVQSGSTKKVTVANLTAGRDVSVAKLTASDNVVIGTAGKGIDFSADPHTAGMTGELLDDYEEGTFTPTLFVHEAPFTSITYGTDVYGRYTKVGNMVTIQIYMRTDAITKGAASGVVRIGGLPFTAGDRSTAGSISNVYAWVTNGPSGFTVFGNNTIGGLFYSHALNGNQTELTINNIATGFGQNQVTLGATYRTV